MDKVTSIRLEHGNDLIVALNFEQGAEFAADGFIIQRTPDQDRALPFEHRGAYIAGAGQGDLKAYLDELVLSSKILDIETRDVVRHHRFDISGLSDEDHKALIEHFYLLNFDRTMTYEVAHS